MIRFQCGVCGRRLNVGDDLAGRSGRCPECGEALRVPDSRPPPRSGRGVATPELPPATGTDSAAQPKRRTLRPIHLMVLLVPIALFVCWVVLAPRRQSSRPAAQAHQPWELPAVSLPAPWDDGGKPYRVVEVEKKHAPLVEHRYARVLFRDYKNRTLVESIVREVYTHLRAEILASYPEAENKLILVWIGSDQTVEDSDMITYCMGRSGSLAELELPTEPSIEWMDYMFLYIDESLPPREPKPAVVEAVPPVLSPSQQRLREIDASRRLREAIAVSESKDPAVRITAWKRELAEKPEYESIDENGYTTQRLGFHYQWQFSTDLGVLSVARDESAGPNDGMIWQLPIELQSEWRLGKRFIYKSDHDAAERAMESLRQRLVANATKLADDAESLEFLRRGNKTLVAIAAFRTLSAAARVAANEAEMLRYLQSRDVDVEEVRASTNGLSIDSGMHRGDVFKFVARIQFDAWGDVAARLYFLPNGR